MENAMSFNVTTNIASMGAQRHLGFHDRNLNVTLARLSSGARIARAADDAAGLAVSENLDANVRGLAVAKRNAVDGISVINTAEQATAEVANIVKRIRELAVQSSSETLANDERAYVQEEFIALQGEIDRIAETTNFNGRPLADGTMPTMDVQVGIHNTANDRITVQTADLHAAVLGVDAGTIDLSTAAGAQGALGNLDTALDTINGYRSNFGSAQNRLEASLRNLEQHSEDLSSARSRIKDADFAYESAEMARHQLLRQAGQAVLGQANSLQKNVVSLLNQGG